MAPRSPDQRRQRLGDGLWQLMAALLQAWDVATDPEKPASALWFSAVGDVTESLLVELISGSDRAGKRRVIHEVQEAADDGAAAVSSDDEAHQAPLLQTPPPHGFGLSRAIDDAVARLQELTMREHVAAWAKRPADGVGGARAPPPPPPSSSASACGAEALMADTVRILALSMSSLHSREDRHRPSADLKAKMCAAVLRVVGRCTVAVEFRRSIQALQRGVFEIRLGSGAEATIRVRLDAVWPAPSELERGCFGLHDCMGGLGSGRGQAYMLRFYRLRVATLADENRALQLQLHPSHGRSGRKGMTRADLSMLLQEWVGKGLVHKCGQKITHSDIYGRENIQESITMQLLSDDRKCKFPVICLAAKRGAGKTTLVRAVFNDKRVSNAFDLRLWLCMSEIFDEKMVMAAIIEQATQVQCNVTEMKFVRELVKDELRERRFLLVLEDWESEHYSFWRKINKILKLGAEGSAVIITTKDEDSAKSFSRSFRLSYFCSLSPLKDEHCLKILQQFACGYCRGLRSDHGLVMVCSNVLYHCVGNPLSVKAICGLLCHAESVLQHLDNLEEAFSPGLKLCHEILPEHLKLCLSVCSLFPKDYVFIRHHLVRLWMSLSFINSKRFRRPEEIGTRYFNELICRSFFEHSSLHEIKEDKFVMPKLFHSMVTSISKDACLRSEDLLCQIPKNIRYLSLVPWERRTVAALHVVTKQAENLDAFLVVNRYELQNSSMASPFVKLEGLDDFLLKFKCLKTLNLSYTIIGQLPASVGTLKNLQYLAINNTDIGRLPPELCLLENLETLEARDCTQLVTLPEDLKNLAKLRHLDVRKHSGHVRMPIGLGQLIHLQSLLVLHVGEGLSDCSIQELRDLDNLHGDLAITGLENVKVGHDAKEAKLINKKKLKTLSFEWSDNSIYLEEDDEEISFEVFEKLQAPHNLENLIVRNYSGSIFPAWFDEKYRLGDLQSITLDNCHSCRVLPALGDLQSLRYLCIRKMHALKTFGDTPLSEERSGGQFPALELLKLWEMYDLDGWLRVKDGDFPRLRTVSICGCPLLKNLPRFPSLVDLSFRQCSQLPEIPELLNLESLRIEGLHDLVSLDLPQRLPALKNLEISRCNELVSVTGLSNLSSIEKLKIVKCPKLDVVNKWQQYHFKKITTTRDATVISI